MRKDRLPAQRYHPRTRQHQHRGDQHGQANLQPVAENVQSLTFTYYNKSGAVVAPGGTEATDPDGRDLHRQSSGKSSSLRGSRHRQARHPDAYEHDRSEEQIMKTARRFVDDESGMTLALAMIMIVLIGVMGAGLLAFANRDLNTVVEENRGQRAFEMADAGVGVAKRQLTSHCAERPQLHTALRRYRGRGPRR